MKEQLLVSLIVAASFCCSADPPVPEARVVIGQPSIFWHNGEWQTYKDGVWTPYGQAATDSAATPNRAHGSEAAVVTTSHDAAEPEMRSGPNHTNPGRRHLERTIRSAKTGNSIGNLGEPNVAIGETTIGIGQPNAGIGQPTIGIGQPNIAIGQPNGIGQTTIGIGRPDLGIGQRDSIGQTTIGIGKPTEFFHQQQRSSRRQQSD